MPPPFLPLHWLTVLELFQSSVTLYNHRCYRFSTWLLCGRSSKVCIGHYLLWIVKDKHDGDRSKIPSIETRGTRNVLVPEELGLNCVTQSAAWGVLPAVNKNMPLTFSHLYKYSSAAKILNVFFFSFLVSCFLFSVSYTVGNLVCSKNSQIYELKGVNRIQPSETDHSNYRAPAKSWG